MKKLMIALVAAATAFGLRAENADSGFISGSDFEIEALDTLWTAVDGTATLTEGSHTIETKRPTQWAKSGNATNLVIKTTLGSPVTQKILAGDDASQKIGTGVYFDGLVNLTVFDVEDTPPPADLDGAKLGVYLQLAKEDESETNLVVVAKGNSGAKNYVCYGADLTPGWHRLTIKAIANIYNEGDDADKCAGFVVFVDNTAVGATGIEGIVEANLTPNAKLFFDNGRLFASLGGADDTLASIQYDGQGVIDEVAFTTVAPFAAAADTDFVQVTWTAANVDTMTIGGKTYTGGTAYAPITYSGDPAAAQPIEVAWIGAGNYVDGSFTITTPSAETPVELDSQMKLAAAILGDAKFETIAAAVVEANKAASGTLVIKNVADGDEDVELNNANVALDLNGQTVGEVGVEGGAAITLTNTDTENDAVVEGTVYPAITVDVKTIKFSIENNSDLEGKPDITVDFGANNWELAAEQADPAKYWVIQEKQDIVIDVPTAVSDLVYDGQPKTGVEEDDGFTLTDNVKTDAGNYTATATLKAGYVWSDKSKDAKQIAWSIAKADVTITTDPTASAEIEKGAKLGTISLVGGSATVVGEFAWTDGDTEVNATGLFSATFTPTDATNYKTATCEVMVTVKEEAKPVVPGQDVPIPSGKSADDYADEINDPITGPALKEKLLVAPNDAEVETTAAYRALFQAVATGDKVTFALTEAAVETLTEAAETAAAAALAADEDGVSIEAPIAGLYYGLKNADALDEMAVTQKVLSDGKAISWDVDKTGAAGFWQVLVGAKNADIPEPVKE